MHKLTERNWLAIAARSFTADGTIDGIVTVSNTRDFRVKQQVLIKATALPPLHLEVKRVLSATQLAVGPAGEIKLRANISAYTTALAASILALEQARRNIEQKEHERAVYAEEPIVAKRVIHVDELGEYYNSTNPLPVTMEGGSVTVVAENLDVQLTHLDDNPDAGDVHDSVRIGDGVEQLAVNPDLSINVHTIDSSVPTILNVSAPIAGTEYSVAIPVGTRKMMARARGWYSTMKVSYTVGMSGTTFFTIAMGSSYVEEQLLVIAPLTLYFQTNKPNQIIEILLWA